VVQLRREAQAVEHIAAVGNPAGVVATDSLPVWWAIVATAGNLPAAAVVVDNLLAVGHSPAAAVGAVHIGVVVAVVVRTVEADPVGRVAGHTAAETWS